MPVPHSEIVSISLHVNGTDRLLNIEPRVSLLDALRDNLRMPGTKKGCNSPVTATVPADPVVLPFSPMYFPGPCHALDQPTCHPQLKYLM